MNLKLKKYLQILTDRNIDDKTNMIINMGLLLEKNSSYENPTDYTLLLPDELINMKLCQEEKDEIVYCLLNLLKNEPIYSGNIVWCIGKTFDEKNIEILLLTIIQMKQYDNETFKQISFLIDVITNEKINRMFHEIELLRKRDFR